MNMWIKAYKLKDSNTVVTNKASIIGAKDEHFEEVSLIIPAEEIRQWAEELEELDDF